MRKQDAVRLGALRMLKAAFMNREIEKGHALDDSEAQQVVASLVKQRKDSIEQFTKGGRDGSREKGSGRDRCPRSAYLPPAADRPSSNARSREAIAETGANRRKTWAG